uniref:Spindle and kinetochore associated complex subunit 3 n=1 Tax=Sinocyclocheilus rhinocerous TaxID=307959 RepID=A0A673KU66_9TELE
MNPSERFFAKLRKLTVCLETESNNLLHASQNPQDDDEDEENGAQALYQLHSEVRALKRQVQDQVATHDATSTELRNFIRRCLVLKQRTTEDIDRLKKHYEKYEMNGRKEVEEQAERDAAEEDEAMAQGICEEAQQSEAPEKMQPPVDQLRTPKLSDFGLSALQFQRVLDEAEPPHIAAPVPAVALSPPPFVMNMHPKTPKCSLRMEEDRAGALYLFYFLLSVFFVLSLSFCYENKFLVCVNIPGNKAHSDSEIFFKFPLFDLHVCVEIFQRVWNTQSLLCFAPQDLRLRNTASHSSPLLKGKNDLDSPPHPNNCPSTPELPAFETPFVSKLIKKDDRQEESDRHRTSQEGSFHLPDLSNTNRAPSFDAPKMPKVLCYENKAIPEMLTLQSLFGSSLAFVISFFEMQLTWGQTPVPIHENGFNQDWCLAAPKIRVIFPTEPCTPEMPDISSVTQDILKSVFKCKKKDKILKKKGFIQHFMGIMVTGLELKR